MAITDHVAILLGHSLDVARLNKKKTRSDYYAQVALPPAAIGDLAELVGAIYPGVPLGTLEVNILTNAQQQKPFPGVPSDWYIIRLASAFAPELYGADGSQFPVQEARSRFFAGMRVRIHTSAWPWKNEFGKSGASFNLHGVMDAGQGGERLAIGASNQSASAFKQFADPTKAAQPIVPGNTHNPAANFAAGGNPGAASVTAGANPFAGGGNPGAVAAGAGTANPFAQAAGGAAAGGGWQPFPVSGSAPGYRRLLAHPESDCVWEVFSEAERVRDLSSDPCVVEVTGVPQWERAFAATKAGAFHFNDDDIPF